MVYCVSSLSSRKGYSAPILLPRILSSFWKLQNVSRRDGRQSKTCSFLFHSSYSRHEDKHRVRENTNCQRVCIIVIEKRVEVYLSFCWRIILWIVLSAIKAENVICRTHSNCTDLMAVDSTSLSAELSTRTLGP